MAGSCRSSTEHIPASSYLRDVSFLSCAALPPHNYCDHARDGWVYQGKVVGSPRSLVSFPHLLHYFFPYKTSGDIHSPQVTSHTLGNVADV